MTSTDPKKRARAAATKNVLPDRIAAERVASEAAGIQLDIEAISLRFKQQIKLLQETAKAEIEEKSKAYKELVAQLNTWAVVNREKEFGDAKTITLAGHKVQFRDSPGKVEFEKGVNEDAVIQALLNLADDEFADQFLRYSTELNRDAIGEHWDADKEILQRLGVRFSKPEIFIFTPDHEIKAEIKVAVKQPEHTAPAAPGWREAA